MSDAGSTSRELAKLGAATVGESGGLPMRARIRPAWPGAQASGPAYTVACAPADNLAIHVGVARAPAGSILVIDASDVPERGYWGEVLTTGAQARDLAGLVIDGGVRDVAALEAHRFPVFSSVIALRGASKDGPGVVGGPVTVGGVRVTTGDWIVADVDGVTAVPVGSLGPVLIAARARAASEDGYFRALRAGQTTVDLLSLDADRITLA